VISDDEFDPGFPMGQDGIEGVPAKIGEAVEAEIIRSKSVGSTKVELMDRLIAAVNTGGVVLPTTPEMLRAYLSKKIDAAIGSGKKSVAFFVRGYPVRAYVRYADEDGEVRTVHARFATLHVFLRSLDLQRNHVAAAQQAYENGVAVAREVEAITNGDMFAFLSDHKDDGEAAEPVAA